MEMRGPFTARFPKKLASIRLGLLRLFALLLGLALLGSALLVWSAYDYARDQARLQILDTTRALARVVDGELLRYDAALRALAVSASVTSHDWKAVDAEARIALPEPFAGLILSDRKGRVIVDTREAGSGFPHPRSLPLNWAGIDQGQPHVCDLGRAPDKQPFICVQTPVLEQGRAAYVMTTILQPRLFKEVLARQRLPDGWRAAILDRQAVLIWRSRMTPEFTARRSSARLRGALSTSEEGFVPARGLEGVSVYMAFSRSPVSGWTIAISVPRSQLDAGIFPALILGVAMVAIFLAIAAAVSVPWMRRLSKGVETLAAGATALARRDDFARPNTRILELNAIAAAIVSADESLRRRDAELGELNATLAERVETAVCERRVALEQLHEARKLETLGQLTGGVAHDFNNLLSPIMGALEMLRMRMERDAKSVRLIDAALISSERAKLLVSRLLSFSRRQALRPRSVDVSALVMDMSDLLRGSLGSPVHLTIDPGVGVAPAHVDPNQLELALLNIAVNARDAMPTGGSLTITVRQEKADGASPMAEGDYVRLSLADTGIGMDETTRQRAINPFFTTKPQGKGSGLGLSMVHGLAAQSGGAFLLTSAPGAGTRADIWLPVTVDVANAVAPLAITDDARGKSILLVDDEDMVRAGTAEMLVDMGFAVTEKASALDALVAMQGGARFDCVITDYKMPGMTGADLIAAVRIVRPDQPIILITGFAGNEVLDIAAIERLAKPFRQKHLAAAITAAIYRATILS